MTDDPNNLTCEGFQAHLPELIGSGEDATAHPHLQDCELCRALLADLETIADAARQLFPIVEPPDALWANIESAIKNEKDAASSPSRDGSKAGTSNSDWSAKRI